MLYMKLPLVRDRFKLEEAVLTAAIGVSFGVILGFKEDTWLQRRLIQGG
jgi:hypothetical protein